MIAPRGAPIRISVICPVFNTPPDLLDAAVRSVLAEPAELLAELILVDDASREPATLAALKRLAAEPRVRVVRNSANAGPSVSRDRGVAVAAGDWIGLIDADDLWIAGRVARIAEVVAAHPKARWIGSNYIDLFPDGRTAASPSIARECPGERLGLDLVRLASPELTRRLILNAWLAIGTVFVRKDLLLQAGGFAAGLYYLEDYFLFMKLTVLADLYFIEADTYVYRRGHASLMSSPARLSPEYARVHEVARAEPLLHGFARELRWARYAAYKGLALNNLLSGRRALALRFALRAWLADPREVADLALFAWLFVRRSREAILRDGGRYSQAERFFLDETRQGVRLAAGE